MSQNLIANEPQLADLLELKKKEFLLSVNAHHIGTIESFDSTKQTATVSINYKKTYYRPNPITGANEPQLVDYPLLVDCPVVCLGGGNARLTFPIAEGDECIVLFNDRDIDTWFRGNSSAGTATPRLHSISDGIALVGVRSLPHVLLGYDDEGSEWSLGDMKLTITDGDLVIETPGGTKITVNDGNIELEVDNGTKMVLTSAGKLTIQNSTGELVGSLYTLFSTGTAAGFPFVLDPTALATLLSFKV